jgi:hypothetical protein
MFPKVMRIVIHATLVAAFVGVAWYGDNVFQIHDDSRCTSPYYRDIADVRSATVVLWIIAAFTLFLGLAGIDEMPDFTSEFQIVTAIGMLTGVTASLLPVAMAYSGSCAFDAGVSDDVVPLAAFVMVIGFIYAMISCMGGDEKPFGVVGSTYITPVIAFFLVATMTSLACIVLRSEPFIRDNYINTTSLSSAHCYASAGRINFESTSYKAYNEIEVWDVQPTKIVRNLRMYNLCIAGVAFTAIYVVCVAANLANRGSDSLHYATKMGACAAFAVAMCVDTLFLGSFLMGNDVPSCTIFKFDQKLNTAPTVFIVCMLGLFASLAINTIVGSRLWTKGGKKYDSLN